MIGLVAAALGVRRQQKEALKELAEFRFGVRVDKEGSIRRDLHIARDYLSKKEPVSYLTHRYYLEDASFVAGLESENRELLERIGQALQAPAFPLYLGRRSCPPTGRVFLEIVEKPLEEALRATALPTSTRLVMDAGPEETGGLVRDVPLSFDPMRREYTYRRVKEQSLRLTTVHDPMAELEE